MNVDKSFRNRRPSWKRPLRLETEASITKPQVRRSLLADFVLVLALVLALAGLLMVILNVADEWKAPFQAETEIDLSFWKLPQYTLCSLARGWVAIGLSFVFAILYASWAYYDRKARTVLLPALDILQSIPVLGFMPGLVLALVTLFPKSNFGLELACVLMIFTAQVWNMVFSYYHALKGVPDEFRQMGKLCHFGPLQRFLKIELPFAAQGLIYNCMVSMAGGWFFLTINEAFTLGDKNFQLPGLGSYMSVAISRDNVPAQIAAGGRDGSHDHRDGSSRLVAIGHLVPKVQDRRCCRRSPRDHLRPADADCRQVALSAVNRRCLAETGLRRSSAAPLSSGLRSCVAGLFDPCQKSTLLCRSRRRPCFGSVRSLWPVFFDRGDRSWRMVADRFKHCRNVPASLCRAGAEFALDDSCRVLMS